MTVQQLLDKCAKLAGVLAEGENLSGEMSTDALDAFNMFLGQWSSDGGLNSDDASAGVTIDSGDSTKSHGATVAGYSVKNIYAANVKKTGEEIYYPLTLIGPDEYATKLTEFQESVEGFPIKYLYIDNSNLYFFPTSSEDCEIFLYTRYNYSTYALTDSISFNNPALLRAIMYNFALDFAVQYNKQPNPLVLKIAEEAKNTVERNNLNIPTLDSDISSGNGNFNIKTGV